MPQSNDDLKQQQQLEELKTAALNAEIARIRAEKALAKEQQTQGPSSADFAVPTSGYKGDVKPGSKAGGIESSLLAARALMAGSRRLAGKLKPVLDAALAGKPTGTSILLYDYGNVPTFQGFVAYKTQYAMVQKTIAGALQALNAATGTGAGAEGIGADRGTGAGFAPSFIPPALAGLALESVDQLLGFFRTDYSVEGIDVKFDDNVALLNALAGQLSGDKYDVRMPAMYSAPTDLTTDPIFAEISALADQDASLRQAIAAGERQLASATAAPPNAAPQPADQAASSISPLKDALDFAKSAQALYDAFYARLTSGDDKGQLPIDTIVRQNAVRTLLQKGAPLLAVRIEKAGGSYYTRKNLWSFFGGMPFYIMGGVVITYALFEGDTGRLLASGTVPVDGGFVRISNLPETLAN